MIRTTSSHMFNTSRPLRSSFARIQETKEEIRRMELPQKDLRDTVSSENTSGTILEPYMRHMSKEGALKPMMQNWRHFSSPLLESLAIAMWPSSPQDFMDSTIRPSSSTHLPLASSTWLESWDWASSPSTDNLQRGISTRKSSPSFWRTPTASWSWITSKTAFFTKSSIRLIRIMMDLSAMKSTWIGSGDSSQF